MNDAAETSPSSAQRPSPGEKPLLTAFKRLRGRLLHTASHMLGSEADAEDALQDAFCRLWGNPAAQRSEQEAAALLTTTVKHLSIDTLRRKASTTVVALDEERDGRPDEEAGAAANREETFARVDRLVATRLTDVQREVLRLREYEGWEFEDIAAKLGMQPAAVRMQLSRARKTIRSCYLEEHGKD